MMSKRALVFTVGLVGLTIFVAMSAGMALSPAPVAAGFTATARPTEPTVEPTEEPSPGGGTDQQPNLWVSKEADISVIAPGDTFTYRIVVQNEGPGTATGVMLQDDVPAELEVLDASVSQGTVTVDGNQVMASVGTLGPGYSAVLTITVRVKNDVMPGTDIVNTVIAWSDQTGKITSQVALKVAGLGAFLPESGGNARTLVVLLIVGGSLAWLSGLLLYLRGAKVRKAE